MKVFSRDNLTWIEMAYATDDSGGYSSYRVEIVTDLKHSRFSAVNLDLHFLNMAAFAAKLSTFLAGHPSEAMLLGTYDTFIRVRGSPDKAMLEYRLGSSFYDNPGARDFAMTGSFALDEPNVKRLLKFAEEHKVDV